MKNVAGIVLYVFNEWIITSIALSDGTLLPPIPCTFIRRLFRIQEHPRRIETSRNRNCRKTQQRTKDAGPTMSHQNPIYPSPGPWPGNTHRIPTGSLHRNSLSESPEPQHTTPSGRHAATIHRDTPGKLLAVKAPRQAGYHDTPPLVKGHPREAIRTRRHLTRHLKEAVSCQGVTPG